MKQETKRNPKHLLIWCLSFLKKSAVQRVGQVVGVCGCTKGQLIWLSPYLIGPTDYFIQWGESNKQKEFEEETGVANDLSKYNQDILHNDCSFQNVENICSR